MANLTIVVDDAVLRRARKKAIDQGTSVNAVVGAYLDQYAGPDRAAEAIEDFLELAASAGATSGEGGRTWTRADLYDRPGLR
jgi:hypothetical protein